MLGNRKDSLGMIMEGLSFQKKVLPSIDEQFSALREEYTDIHEAYNYEIAEPVDEAKTVTFGNATYPKYGWCVVMAGGSGLN